MTAVDGQRKEPVLSAVSTSIAVAPQPTAALAPRHCATPVLSVVIVNYRQWDKTEQLVRHLQNAECVKNGFAEIVIVDNNSPPHPATKRLRRMPNVSVRLWKQNHGFARAVNEGCRLSMGDWLLLLNADTTPADDFLDDVANRLNRLDAKAGIVGFHLRNSDGTRQLSTGSFPTLASTLARLILPRSRRKYQVVTGDLPTPVEWVTGCCLLIRQQCLREAGGLDEHFFLYYEDVDLCRRAAERGWSVWFDPGPTIVHHHPLHQRAVPAVLRMVTRHSLMVYAKKHWPSWQFRTLNRIVQAEALLRSWNARRIGDLADARTFDTLGRICADMRNDDGQSAHERITNAVRRIDVRVGV